MDCAPCVTADRTPSWTCFTRRRHRVTRARWRCAARRWWRRAISSSRDWASASDRRRASSLRH
eukprot:scaffold2805_cov202-Prasinococcus_capsulatus_cf.AAC.4